jgi:NAD(P)H-nitrite reductase large subunit
MAKNFPKEMIPNAIVQRDGQSYAIIPNTPTGIITPEELDRISNVAKKYDIPAIKITSGQRIALVGLEEDDIPSIWQELDMAKGQAQPGETSLHYVQACPGIAACKYGVQDAIGLGKEIEKIFSTKKLPAKLKVGVSGCSFSCGESMVRDIGLLGKKSGWSLVIGGNAARRPRIGDIVAERLTKAEVIQACHNFLDFYCQHANERERTARFCERMGIAHIKQKLKINEIKLI